MAREALGIGRGGAREESKGLGGKQAGHGTQEWLGRPGHWRESGLQVVTSIRTVREALVTGGGKGG